MKTTDRIKATIKRIASDIDANKIDIAEGLAQIKSLNGFLNALEKVGA